MKPLGIRVEHGRSSCNTVPLTRTGAADTKTVVIIIVGVVGGVAILSCLLFIGVWFYFQSVGAGQFREFAEEVEARSDPEANLRHLGLGLHNYHDVHRTLPPGGIYGEDGTAYHSWQYCLLPYVDAAFIYNHIDRDLPWTDPVHAEQFGTVVPKYVHPFEQGDPHAASGYALSHYAGNASIFSPNSRVSVRDVTDGTSNTLMVGEVGAGFKPWGDPTNVRDPAEGIAVGPETFGRNDAEAGALMVLVDGSVRFIASDIDPETLKALATHDGGEWVGEF